MANQQAVQVNIDPDGDVVFICTYMDSSTSRLRVSAKVVSLASPVLKAMLSPHFREGATLATASYVEIELPEDDAEAMRTLLLIMHSKNDRLRGYGMNLKALAETVDKYDCVATVATAAYYWISKAMEDTDEDGLRDLLEQAYVLRQHELFAAIGRDLVLDSEEPIRGPPGILTNVYSSLEDERMKALLALSAAVQNHVLAASNIRKKNTNGCVASCHYQEFYALAVIRRLGESKLWPIASPGNTSVRELMERMRKADFSDLANSASPTCVGDPNRGSLGACVGKSSKVKDNKVAKYVSVVRDVDSKIRDLCLCCVQQGSPVFGAEDCDHDASEDPFTSI